MRRRIKRAIIKHISLCRQGKNGLQTIYKAADGRDGSAGTVEFATLTKFDAEKGELLACVYAPELRDSDGDIASAEVIKEMAYEYARRGEGIDIRHDGKTIDRNKAFVAEQFIIQKGDARFADMRDYAGNVVDVTGGWGVVMKLDDPELRAKYGAEGWNGVSMGGEGEVVIEKSADPSDQNAFATALLKRLGLIPNGDTDMTPEQVAELRKQITKDVTDAITPLIKAPDTPPAPNAPKPLTVTPNAGESLADFTARVSKEQPEATGAAVLEAFNKAQDKPNRPAKPIFKGDWGNVEDVEKHEKAMARYELAKDVDFDNAQSIAKYREALAAFDAEDTDENEPVYKTDLEREQAAEIARLRKASNQPNGKSPKTANDGTLVTGVSKEEADLYAAGARDGALFTKSRDENPYEQQFRLVGS